ncbi:hypothetical protein NDU88_000798 [Pleurodeles waltl]|uniref:Uncharacterized protein n=1 Tax=Pleurodeles waltl TaxID=8319 RepID=A0AAV7NI96_PLEWA|nr:hypothetical protein NDU88_000798 [Pleurodeles waltl]
MPSGPTSSTDWDGVHPTWDELVESGITRCCPGGQELGNTIQGPTWTHPGGRKVVFADDRANLLLRLLDRGN